MTTLRSKLAVIVLGTLAVLLLPAAAMAQGTLFVEGDRVGVGIDTPTQKLHVYETTDTNTFVTAENAGGGLSSAGVLRARSNAAVVNFQAHGNGRTITRFGEGLAGWAEFLQVTGNGLIIGTVSNRPLILGTNSNNVLEITSGGDVLYQGVAVHSDYVFEPDYELPSIEEQEEFMWSNKHLPAIGPARFSEDGREMMELGSDRQAIVEELEKAHIYIAQLNDRLNEKATQVEVQNQEIESLTQRLERLEAALSGN